MGIAQRKVSVIQSKTTQIFIFIKQTCGKVEKQWKQYYYGALVCLLCPLFCSPFPTVAESIQKELDEYRASEEEVKRLKNVMVRFHKNNFALLISRNNHRLSLEAIMVLPDNMKHVFKSKILI